MGHWSVYCGISNISIGGSDEIVFLPIKPNKGFRAYDKFLPATLPIFGTYDDYGRMEKIEKDENTKLLEEYFEVPIEDFVELFLDGHLTYAREGAEEIRERFPKFDEVKDWNFMFISRKVFDFMTSFKGVGSHDSLPFGNTQLLEYLGFTFVEKLEGTRYNLVYEMQGKKVYSDGQWVNLGKNESIFYFDEKQSRSYSLTHYFDIPEDKMWLKTAKPWDLYEIITEGKFLKEKFRYMMNLPDMDIDGFLKKSYNRLKELYEAGEIEKDKWLEYEGSFLARKQPDGLDEVYSSKMADFYPEFSKLYNLFVYSKSMSKSFEPYVLYITPQDGDYATHQELLKGFMKINAERIYNEEED